jgi:hypothetical protein
MSNMLRDMYVPYGDPYTLTLSGLTVGADYSTRIYYRPWENNQTRTVTLTFNGDGTPAPITINQDAGSSAHYVAYDFTASGNSVTVNFSSSAWHLYGATNQVIPEPAAALLGSFGMLGLASSPRGDVRHWSCFHSNRGHSRKCPLFLFQQERKIHHLERVN